MSRISKMTSVFMAGIMLFAVNLNPVASYALAENHVTVTVKKQDVIIEVNTDVDVNFLENTDILFESEYGNATFIKFLVDRGQEVTEGQDIAEIQYTVDEIEYAQLEINLRRAEDSYRDYITGRDAEIANLKAAVRDAATDTELKIAKLKLEKRQMEIAKEDARRLETVEAARKKISDVQESQAITTIKAPTSGIIGWLQRRNNGDSIHDGSYMGVIMKFDAESVAFMLNDPNGIIRYGMEVTLNDQRGNKYAAHVVSSSNAGLTNGMRSKSATIIADEPLPSDVLWGKIGVTYETVHLENIIAVPTSAVNKDKRGNYVKELVNGVVINRYVTLGREVKDQYFIADGLSDGAVVVLD